MEHFSYLCKRSRIGEWLKYLCFEKYFHFLNIAVYRIIHWFRPLSLYSVFLPFITNIFELASFIFMGIREELTATSDLPTQAAQPPREDFSFDVLGTRILFHAFVGYYCCIVNILTRVCMWNIGLCGSVAQPWVHLKHLGASYPSGQLDHRPVNPWSWFILELITKGDLYQWKFCM